MTLKDQIIQDIYDHHRLFLPGQASRPEDVAKHMEGSINIDGISDEERLLMLSILPRNAEQLWVSPLDKGLSGSNVFSIRYTDTSARFSKTFIVKVGPLKKIDHEADVTHRLAAPYLHGVESPVCRRGYELGLIGQELRGLSAHVTPESLRIYLRNTDHGTEVVQRLLEERLDPWYSRSGETVHIPVSQLMQDYLAKGPVDVTSILPDGWQELVEWTQQIAGFSWGGVGDVVTSILSGPIRTPICIIHGDLHSQNILVDSVSKECWPIDFAWCRESSPLIDLAMLECSLKFLAIPMRSDLRTLLAIEARLAEEPGPVLISANIPYFPEINRIVQAISILRNFALSSFRVPFSEFRKMLLVMTYTLSPHPGLNLPFVIGSLQILAGAVG
jgi:hypothetical protein